MWTGATMAYWNSEMNKDGYSLGWRKWSPESMMTSRIGDSLSRPGCPETHPYQASRKAKSHNQSLSYNYAAILNRIRDLRHVCYIFALA